MQVDIITPDKVLFSGNADSVTLPGTLGQFQILNNHAPIISSLTSGQVVLNTSEGLEYVEISGGVVEVMNNKIVILA